MATRRYGSNGKRNQLSSESRQALKAINLHFHDLRAEFGSRIIESGSTLVEARNLGHSSVNQTTTYLRSKSKTLQTAIGRKRRNESGSAARTCTRARLPHSD